jgi:hypothetical protein
LLRQILPAPPSPPPPPSFSHAPVLKAYPSSAQHPLLPPMNTCNLTSSPLLLYSLLLDLSGHSAFSLKNSPLTSQCYNRLMHHPTPSCASCLLHNTLPAALFGVPGSLCICLLHNASSGPLAQQSLTAPSFDLLRGSNSTIHPLLYFSLPASLSSAATTSFFASQIVNPYLHSCPSPPFSLTFSCLLNTSLYLRQYLLLLASLSPLPPHAPLVAPLLTT